MLKLKIWLWKRNIKNNHKKTLKGIKKNLEERIVVAYAKGETEFKLCLFKEDMRIFKKYRNEFVKFLGKRNVEIDGFEDGWVGERVLLSIKNKESDLIEKKI